MTASTPRSASTRTRREATRSIAWASCATLLGTERAVAVGETGLDYHYGSETKDEQRRLFEAQLELARELDAPGRDPYARSERRHRVDAPCASTARSSCTASPSRASSRPALERGWYFSFAGNVTYPKAAELREAAAEVPADRILAETDSPYLSPQPLRGKPNEPAHVVHTVAALAAARGEDADELAAQHRRERHRSLRPRVSVDPKKQLGQHFLVDENILGVIGRLAELGDDDVVLEIGPGLGVLTRYLADRVAHVHAVELDRSLEPHLAEVASRAERRRPLGRRARARPGRVRAGADEARCEPSLQRRDADRRREPRPACRASSCGA